MPETDELFTTYGPTFFKAMPSRALADLNEIREKQGLDRIEASGLSASWKQAEKTAQILERKAPLPADPITFIMGY